MQLPLSMSGARGHGRPPFRIKNFCLPLLATKGLQNNSSAGTFKKWPTTCCRRNQVFTARTGKLLQFDSRVQPQPLCLFSWRSGLNGDPLPCHHCTISAPPAPSPTHTHTLTHTQPSCTGKSTSRSKPECRIAPEILKGGEVSHLLKPAHS